jgi:hypothetical protein
MSPAKIDQELLHSVYQVLKPVEDKGMVTMIFRYQLGDLIQEDDDDLLLEMEETLIKEGWIIQDHRNRLLTASEKLRSLFES